MKTRYPAKHMSKQPWEVGEVEALVTGRHVTWPSLAIPILPVTFMIPKHPQELGPQMGLECRTCG